MNKKGNEALTMIMGIVMGLIVLSIYLAVSFQVTSTIRDTQIDKTLTTVVRGESMGALLTGQSYRLINPQVASVDAVWNSTGNMVLSTKNYTVTDSYDGGKIITLANTAVGFNGTGLKVNYTIYNLGDSYNASQSIYDSTATIPTWIPVIVIVVIAGAIIGLLKAFGVF